MTVDGWGAASRLGVVALLLLGLLRGLVGLMGLRRLHSAEGSLQPSFASNRRTYCGGGGGSKVWRGVSCRQEAGESMGQACSFGRGQMC